MTCMNITGLSRYQTRKISEMIHAILQEDVPKEDYKIAFVTPVNLMRQNSLWYGGTVAEIYYKGRMFSIEAVGDIRAYLHDTVDDTQIFDVKDRSNCGRFMAQCFHI